MSPVDRAEARIKKRGRVHLTGIGGIGMAGIAFLLKERGLEVSGCDLQENRQTAWLKKNGITVFLGHNASHITQSMDWVIRSTAVPSTHPEVRRADELGIPVSRRGDVLPALMRDRICIAVSGTHGKTTTTAMIAQVLGCGYCIGGEIEGIEGVAREGELMVVEADESDGTLVGYTSDYSIITNIEYDHMEHHASEAALVGCFERFIMQTKKTVYYCPSDPIASRLCSANPKCTPYRIPEAGLNLLLPGHHNQWNAAAAMAVSRPWKTKGEILHALRYLQPVRRRFETVFEREGIQIVSDYAHHPTEIAALIQTALESKPKRLIGVFQPHRYTRTLALGADFPNSFTGLDALWIVPVYAASEQPIEGGTTADLIARFPHEWRGCLHECPSLKTAWSVIRSELREGDLLLVIGAGDIEEISEWARYFNPDDSS